MDFGLHSELRGLDLDELFSPFVEGEVVPDSQPEVQPSAFDSPAWTDDSSGSFRLTKDELMSAIKRLGLVDHPTDPRVVALGSPTSQPVGFMAADHSSPFGVGSSALDEDSQCLPSSAGRVDATERVRLCLSLLAFMPAREKRLDPTTVLPPEEDRRAAHGLWLKLAGSADRVAQDFCSVTTMVPSKANGYVQLS